MGKGMLSCPGQDGDVLQAIDGSLFIGSAAECAVRIKDAAPRQCQIVRTSEGYVARDLTGQKLLSVNGVRVDHQKLQPGDVLRVASGEFLFSVSDEPEAPVAPAPAIRIPERVRPRPERRVAVRKPRLLIVTLIGAAILLVAVGVLIVLPTSDAPAPTSPAKASVRISADSATAGPADSKPVREVVIEPVRAASAAGEKGEEVSAQPPPLLIRPAEPSPSFTPSPGPSPAALAGPLPAILRFYDRPDRVGPSDEAAARTSPLFALRYAAVLLQVHRAFAKGTGYEAAYRALLEASPAGGPDGAAAHLKALAASLKEAITCKECKNGRVTCPSCQGKTRVDVNCIACDGRGRVRPSGAIGNTDVSVKCRNCEGIGIFRGVGCGGCSRSGSVGCSGCKGSPWREAKCYNVGCKDGRLACGTCQGRGWEQVKCPFCTNGRARAPGAVDNADVTMKCRNCEIDGRQGNGTFKQDCKACAKSGKVTCDGCGGVFAGKAGPGFREVPVSRVFRTEGCAVASVAGGAAHECSKCVGLGVRIRPVSDPSKTLD